MWLSVQGHWVENHAFKIQERNYPEKKPFYFSSQQSTKGFKWSPGFHPWVMVFHPLSGSQRMFQKDEASGFSWTGCSLSQTILWCLFKGCFLAVSFLTSLFLSLSLPPSSLSASLPLIYILSFYSYAVRCLPYYPQYTLLQFYFLFLVSLFPESCSSQFCYNVPEFCKLYHWFTAKNDVPIAALFGQLFWILNTVSVSVSIAFTQGDGVSLWCWWNSSSRSGVCRRKSRGEEAFWGTLGGAVLCSLKL